ncbi:ABC transporter substrate-binding protein [Leisingera sp. HS039]|uniref:ABC transporter substrate-binding protein n=1 Tax=unclassified Leisingera TaxID=2614906 RepID=UPI00107071BB|nr:MULTISPECIES: ABC transporter substrate-binding protein [unclassified Leisingera]MBQ4826040.1 ABC transporter substrate-binding protein [Leisingera sp. HS039]QBR37095.1 ABC transporter substrate-binding protein [Leisingera sp. NJS201]
MFLRSGLIGLSFIAAAQAAAASETFPLTIENCGQSVTFKAPAASSVTVGQAATEVLYALGLGDKVLGTSVWFNDVLPEYADLNAKIDRLADNDPSFESVVAKRPGLVAAQYEWHVGPEGVVAKREQFHDLGIPTYVMPADCVGKDNTTGGDGTRTQMFTTGSLYQGIEELAAIFGEADKGAELVAEYKAREAAAVAKAQKVALEDATAVFWFSSPEMESDPFVAGEKGAPGYMMQQLGLRNVIETDEEWPTVGWETIAKANPTVIVIARMDRRRFAADDFEKKLDFLRNDPVASQMDAVKNNRIVVMDAQAMDATIRAIPALEDLAAELSVIGTSQ